MSELGTALGQGLSNQQNMQQNLVKPGSIPTQFVISSYSLKVQSTNVTIESKDAGLSFILGSSTNGIFGTNKLGDQSGTYSTVYSSSDVQTLTHSGRNWVRDFFALNSTSPNYLLVGSGTTSYNQSDTALESELTRVSSISANTGTDFICSLYKELYPGQGSLGGSTFYEFAWGNASTSGTILSRRVTTGTIISSTRYTKVSESFLISDNSIGDTKIVNTGLNLVRDWLGGVSVNRPSYTGIGMGTGTVPSSLTLSSIGIQDRNAVNSYTTTPFKVRMSGLISNSEPITTTGTILSVYVQQTELSNGISGGNPLLIDNCSTITWGTVSYSTIYPTMNTTSYFEGGNSFNMGKNGSAVQTFGLDLTSTGTFDSTNRWLTVPIYIRDKTLLLESSATYALELRTGQDNSNYYSGTWLYNSIFNGNYIYEFNPTNGTTIGSPSGTGLDYFCINLNSATSTTLITLGDIRMDYVHLTSKGTATLFGVNRISPTYKTNLFKLQTEDYIEVV